MKEREAGRAPLAAAPGLEVQVAVAKVGKYAVRESGDTVETIERPRGGLSVVMADGQRSGRSAKAISTQVVQKAITLLAEGVRDGAAARAAHDALHTQRGGQVSAELTILSVDLATRTLVISRNSRCPALLLRAAQEGEACRWLDAPSEAIGIYANTKPSITELPLEAGVTLLAFSDGVWAAGARSGRRMDIPQVLAALDPLGCESAACLADGVLAEALRLDDQRPHDDATVVVVQVRAPSEPSSVRRMSVRFPIEA